MKYLKHLVIILSAFSICLVAKAQFYNRAIGDTNYFCITSNFTQNSNDYMENVDESNIAQEFLRWQAFWRPRTSPSGNFYSPSYCANQNTYNFHQNSNSYQTNSNYSPAVFSNWTELGPNTNGQQGIGRVSAIEFDPGYDGTTNQTIYLGANDGGVWVTFDNGENWSNLNTDTQLPQLDVTDIAIDPSSSSIIFISTGGNKFTDGIYRTFDGGQTWLPINGGLFDMDPEFSINKISKLLIDPIDNDVLYAATSIGIYKTTNRNGISPHPVIWTKVYPTSSSGLDENVINIMFAPGSNQTLYASGLDIIRSTSFGDDGTWNSIARTSPIDLSGTPVLSSPLNTQSSVPSGCYPCGHCADNNITDNIYVVDIAISADNLFLYATIIATDVLPMTYNSNICNSFFKFDISNGSWIRTNSIPNQEGDRHPLIVHPLNNQYVATGSVNANVTADGGDTWGAGYGTGHSDIHVLKFSPIDPCIIFSGTDGGLWRSKIYQNCEPPLYTLDLRELNNGLGIATLYNTGSSANDPYQILCGMQDCGTKYFKNNQWSHVMDGDGFECLIDYNNPSIMYGTIPFCNGNGDIQRSNNSVVTPNFNATIMGTWATANFSWESSVHGAPLVMDPFNSTILYQGRFNIWKTTDAPNTGDINCGVSMPNFLWNRISNFDLQLQPKQGVVALAVAPSNNNYIYASLVKGDGTQNNRLVKTTIGGGLNTGDWSEVEIVQDPEYIPEITGISVSEKDPNHIWITFSGYDETYTIFKVWESFDGGDTWYNIPWVDGNNNALPNIPVNCIVYEKGTNEAVYIGTDIGVYYKNATMDYWEPFMTNFPHVIVSQLEINYTANVLRAATYGRGLWESNLACPSDNPDPLILTALLSYPTSTPPGEFDEAKNIYSTETIDNSNGALKVYYRASNYIHLDDGFGISATSGSNFHAYIHGCDVPGNTNPLRITHQSYYKPTSKIKNKVAKDHLSICYPNPFSNTATIEFTITDPEPVSISVFNTFGVRQHILLNNELKEAGNNKEIFDGKNFNAGVYYYIITIGSKSETGKMVLIKN